jgi:hypothetical protein
MFRFFIYKLSRNSVFCSDVKKRSKKMTHEISFVWIAMNMKWITRKLHCKSIMFTMKKSTRISNTANSHYLLAFFFIIIITIIIAVNPYKNAVGVRKQWMCKGLFANYVTLLGCRGGGQRISGSQKNFFVP